MDLTPKEENNLLVTTIAAGCTSLAVVTVVNPLDVTLINLQNHATPGHKIRNYMDSYKEIVKEYGYRGFYRGSGLAWLRIAPHTILTLTLWDYLRTKYHLKHPDKMAHCRHCSVE